jgi:hypothetical protein
MTKRLRCRLGRHDWVKRVGAVRVLATRQRSSSENRSDDPAVRGGPRTAAACGEEMATVARGLVAVVRPEVEMLAVSTDNGRGRGPSRPRKHATAAVYRPIAWGSRRAVA